MSMYTRLLDAALRERPLTEVGAREHALGEVIRCRRDLEDGVPPGAADTVPVALALQIAYDVALVEMARAVGVDTDPNRFEQPQTERERLERALSRSRIIEMSADDPAPPRC
jgi:hypothetical protein